MSRGDRREDIFLNDVDRKGGDLLSRPKNDWCKLAIAARVRRETTLSIKVIAARVGLGTAKSANIRLHAAMKAAESAEAAQARLDWCNGANHVMG